MDFHELVSLAALALEAAGIAVILGGVVVVVVVTGWTGIQRRDLRDWYRRLREGIGRAIMLGLEILVGADIIRTVAETPTFRSVAILGGIVLIRTFLSFTLTGELEGRWPWQRNPS